MVASDGRLPEGADGGRGSNAHTPGIHIPSSGASTKQSAECVGKGVIVSGAERGHCSKLQVLPGAETNKAACCGHRNEKRASWHEDRILAWVDSRYNAGGEEGR